MCGQRSISWLLMLVALGAMAERAAAQTKLLRFPDSHGDHLVFTYGGDLWSAPAAGGTATRLTAHPGLELFARFSPDGRWIAFTGQYDGDEQVYVVASAGGVPRQLTFYPASGPLPPRWGYDNQVYGWTPDGEAVLFRSLRDSWDVGDSQLFTVAVEGGLPTPLPMPESGAGDFSPEGDRVVYSPLVRDFRHWKRYQGGWAQELYIFDLATHATTRVSDHPRADRDPMWIGDEIYFTSDRDDKNNLFVYHVGSGQAEQVTFETVWDIRCRAPTRPAAVSSTSVTANSKSSTSPPESRRRSPSRFRMTVSRNARREWRWLTWWPISASAPRAGGRSSRRVAISSRYRSSTGRAAT